MINLENKVEDIADIYINRLYHLSLIHIFNKAIIQSKKEISQLDDNGSDIKIFDIGFKITKKQINSQIE